jgi:hypothetical protein
VERGRGGEGLGISTPLDSAGAGTVMASWRGKGRREEENDSHLLGASSCSIVVVVAIAVDTLLASSPWIVPPRQPRGIRRREGGAPGRVGDPPAGGGAHGWVGDPSAGGGGAPGGVVELLAPWSVMGANEAPGVEVEGGLLRSRTFASIAERRWVGRFVGRRCTIRQLKF